MLCGCEIWLVVFQTQWKQRENPKTQDTNTFKLKTSAHYEILLAETGEISIEAIDMECL